MKNIKLLLHSDTFCCCMTQYATGNTRNRMTTIVENPFKTEFQANSDATY